MKIVLLANWGLGLEIIKSLHKMQNIEIALVVTQYQNGSPDLWFNVVHDFSCEKGYKTIDQENVSFSELRQYIEKLNIELLISHAYMRILPKEVYSAPKYGCINIHPSMLPKYRGPSPTQWVIRNRETLTGLTCHFIDEGVDTGDIIYQVEIPVKPNDTVSSVIERQKTVVRKLIIESIARVGDSNFKPIPQKSENSSYVPKEI